MPGSVRFTADQVTKINGRDPKSNIYYRDNMGIEHHTMGRSTSASSERQAGGLAAAVADEAFQNVPYKAEQDLKVSRSIGSEVSREEIGTETREGHPTTLYEVTVKEGERTECITSGLPPISTSP